MCERGCFNNLQCPHEMKGLCYHPEAGKENSPSQAIKIPELPNSYNCGIIDPTKSREEQLVIQATCTKNIMARIALSMITHDLEHGRRMIL